MRLSIPAIKVEANIQEVGVNSKGEMDVPGNIFEVGWFKLGPKPGEKGSAVISGHFNGKNNEAGVFIDLDKLKVGDKVYVEDGKGFSTSFVVRETQTYIPGYADDVFSKGEGVYLNLVTCDGVWDGGKKSFSKRLVVYTDLVVDKLYN
jgi:LPXTG-site transpeptidase (sortase) family protein